MRSLSVFIFISLDGYYQGPDHDISWHDHDSEGAAYSLEGLQPGNMLVFGRLTYEMMASFWQCQEAFKNLPEIAAAMNDAEKLVFSNTLRQVSWKNTTLCRSDMIEEMKRLKQTTGKNMTILGSANLLAQLASERLVDQFEIMISPVAIGSGTPLFQNVPQPLRLKRTGCRLFNSGAVLLTYRPG